METEASVDCSRPCPPESKSADCGVGAGSPGPKQKGGCARQPVRRGGAPEAPGNAEPTEHLRLQTGMWVADGRTRGGCEPSGPRRVSAVDCGCGGAASSSFEFDAREGEPLVGRGWEDSAGRRVQTVRVDWASFTLTSVFTDLGAQRPGHRWRGQMPPASCGRRAIGLFDDDIGYDRRRQGHVSACGMPRLWWVQRGRADGLEAKPSPNFEEGTGAAIRPPVAAHSSKAAAADGKGSGERGAFPSRSTEDCAKKGIAHTHGDTCSGSGGVDAADLWAPSDSGRDGRCDFSGAVSSLAVPSDPREGRSSNGSTGGHSSLMKIHIRTRKAGCDASAELPPGDDNCGSSCHGDRSPSAETEGTNQGRPSTHSDEEGSPTVSEKMAESISQTISHSANALELFSDSSSREDWTSQWVARHTGVGAPGARQRPEGTDGSLGHVGDCFSDVGVSGEECGADGGEGSWGECRGRRELLRSQSNPEPERRGTGVVNFMKKLRKRAKGRKKSGKLGWLPAAMCLGASARVADKDGRRQGDVRPEERKKTASAEDRRSRHEDAARLLSRTASDSQLQLRRSGTCDLQHQLFCDGPSHADGQPSHWRYPSFGKESSSPYVPDSLFSDSLFSLFSTQTPTQAQFWPGLDSVALAARRRGALLNSDSQNLTITWCSHTGTSLFSGFSMQTPTRAQFWPGKETLGIWSSGTMERTVSSRHSPPRHPSANSMAVSHQPDNQLLTGQPESLSRNTTINHWIQQGVDAAAQKGSLPAHGPQAPVLDFSGQLSGGGIDTGPDIPSPSASPQSAAGRPAPLNASGAALAASATSGSAKIGSSGGMQSMEAAKRCNGKWKLDNQQTDNLQGLSAFMELGWWKQGASNANDLFKVQVRGRAYYWSCDVLRLCEAATRLPLSGAPVTQRRLDGRPGYTVTWAEPREEGMAVM
ncbi:unnamed protein product [Ostreobium quekettii]|uniref:Uncharacterized protein n=1 Tax=Ostreobium quekettii TaxID=121088 RepID=A0A8S1IM89_9CHLO|nr:unnamed protein product [Ostreobium quekettii]|eukprot:evm.model.scf_2726.3 EVM.evm.TU.scf_2726.3   scf_2726:12464-17311(+)